MPRLVIGFVGVLIALWTLLCLGLFAAFGFGSGMLRMITEWLTGANADGPFGLLTAAGGGIAFLIWLIGTTALGFIGWMMARANGVVVYTSGPRASGHGRRDWDAPPMKDVTPPRGQPHHPDERDLPPR